ncbi:MAG: hypothetical protein RR267_06660 [Erysipelotrichaceae bacterium]
MSELLNNFILGSLLFWSFYYLCHKTMRKFSSTSVSFFIMLALYAGASCCYFFIDILPQLEYIAYIFGFLPFIIAPLLFKDELRKILYIFGFNFLFITVCSNFMLFFFQGAFIQVPPSLITYKLEAMIAFYFVVFLFINFLLSKSIKRAINTTHLVTISILSCLYIACSLILITYPYLYNEFHLIQFDYLQLQIILHASFFLLALIFHCYLVMRPSKEKNAPEVLETVVVEKEIPEEPQEETIDDVDLMKSKFIDNILLGYQVIENKICMDHETYEKLSQSLANSNSLTAKVYLDQLELESQSYRLKHLCDSETINKVLAFYQYQYLQSGIYLHTTINLNNPLIFNEIDLSFLIAHFLDKAKKASLASTLEEEPYINFFIKNKDNHMMMIIDINSDKENDIVDPLYESLVASMKGKIDVHSETKFSPSKILSMYIDITKLS